MMVWNDLLDEALNRLSDESTPDIVSDYPFQADTLQPLLATAAALENIRPVTLPTPAMLDIDRLEFLSQVNIMAETAVSPGAFVRLKRWITNYFPIQTRLMGSRKEPKQMSTLIAKAALLIAVLFGAAGGTAVLSADSLPDSTLYPVKLVIEDTRLSLVSDPVKEADLHMKLAETRLREIIKMARQGRASNGETFSQLQNHYEAAFQLAAALPDEAMLDFLVQAEQRIQTQTQNLEQTQAQVTGAGEASLSLANGVMSQVQQQVEAGLQEPQMFRWRHGNMPEDKPQETGPCNTGDCDPSGQNNQYGQDPENTGQNGPGNNQYGQNEGNTGHNGPGDGDGICDNPDGCEPVGDANQYGQNEDNTGHNGPGDGDGICDNPDGCEPIGDANQYGQNEDSTGHYGPGYGDGVCDNPDGCEPVGDANQYGQNEDNSGHNGPGDGDGICDNPDGCEPVGDANQYGQNEDNTGQNGPGDGDGTCDNPDGCQPAGDENQNQNNEQNGSGNGGSGSNSSGDGNQNSSSSGSQSGQGGKGK